MTRRWLISLPVWGDAYAGKFAATLPALRLAAAGVAGDRLLVLHTDRPELAGMSSEVLPVEARPIHVSGDGYYVTMSRAYREVIAMARPGDVVVHMVADAMISANAFAACEAAFARGKKVVAVCPVRAFDDCGRAPHEDSRALLAHAWKNRHPITRNSTWPGVVGAYELSRIFFEDGENVVARNWLPHPLAFLADGRDVTFGNSPDLDLIDRNFLPDEIHLVTDPDEMAYVAMESRSRTFSAEPPISDRLYRERLSPTSRWLLSHRICICGRGEDLGDAAVVAPLLRASSRSEEFWAWYDNVAAPKLKGRAETFRKMFKHLDRFDRPVHIVETGCIEELDNWAGNGCSTILFDRYRETHPGSEVRSVDVRPDKIAQVNKVLPEVKAVCDDSVAALKYWANKEYDKPSIDLLYLDASHFDWDDPVPAALHHLNELMAAMPMLRADTLVVVDDSPAMMDEFPMVQVGGKGELVARYAFSVGADLEFLDYQAGWTNVTAKPPKDVVGIEELILRARGHVEGDRLVAAAPIYRLILSLTLPPWPRGPHRIARGEACEFFAKVALAKNRFNVAAHWYHEALRADPGAVEYRLELATKCYLNMGRGMFDAAVTEADRATRIEPSDVRAWQTLGGIEHEQRRLDRAAAALDRAVSLAPGNLESALFRAALALDMSDHDLVRELCAGMAGTEFEPDATHVLAMVAARESRHEDAIALYDRAMAAGCRDLPMAHWHKSTSMEAVGLWPQAWAEREHRVDAKKEPALVLPMVRFDRPRWDGQPAPASVHVHAEAGSGDNLAMVRYLPLLRDMGLDVRYEAQDDMVDLVRRSMPGVKVLPKAADYPGVYGIQPFDYHLPIGGLQHAFRTTLETVPWDGPYIHADPVLKDRYRALLAREEGRRGLGRRRKVGLVWSSGIRLNDSAWLAEYGRRKSMHFDHLGREFVGKHDSPKATYVSLQVGPERSQQWTSPSVVDALPAKPTWDDTAALIANLDLVITVDTGVAHLAGAMGKPVWVLMQKDGGSWHFMCERPGAVWNERSPWYPLATRIFRQESPGDWAGVVARVAAELERGEASLVA